MPTKPNEQQPMKSPKLPDPKEAPGREKKGPVVPSPERDREFVSDPMVPKQNPPQGMSR